jgi:predicted nucleic acid-binding protein
MPDVHSHAAVAWVAKSSDSVFLSSLVALEVVNAIQMRVFRRERTVRQATLSIQAFEGDASNGILRLLPVPASAWDVAKKLSSKHSPTLGTRSLDIMQVAIAISFRTGTFLTFDRNQAALARAEGLAIPI